MWLGLILAATPLQVTVTVNGIDAGKSCRVLNMETEDEAANGEAVQWATPADLRIVCRRATGDLIRVVKGVSGKKTINLKMGFAILWTRRDGDRINGRIELKRVGGDETVEALPGAQTPLLPGSWTMEVWDDKGGGWLRDEIVVRQAQTLEKTIDFVPGRVRIVIATGPGQVDLLGPDGKSAGYGPSGAWIDLPPNRYAIQATLQDDLSRQAHEFGSFTIRSGGRVERLVSPKTGTLRWGLKQPLAELRLLDERGETVIAEGLTGKSWKVSPGKYRVQYRLPSHEVLGVEVGQKADLVEVKAGATTKFGAEPKFGRVVVRLRRGRAPQYGRVELLNPADGELAARFTIGQEVSVAPGRWPLRVVASDGRMIPHDKPLVVRAGSRQTVDLVRAQSRLRVTLVKRGERSRGTWQVLRDGDEPQQAVSGEAMDLDPGSWILRVRCATGRGGQERAIELEAGVDQEEEFLCE